MEAGTVDAKIQHYFSNPSFFSLFTNLFLYKMMHLSGVAIKKTFAVLTKGKRYNQKI
jgi:hypothetical protein